MTIEQPKISQETGNESDVIEQTNFETGNGEQTMEKPPFPDYTTQDVTVAEFINDEFDGLKRFGNWRDGNEKNNKIDLKKLDNGQINMLLMSMEYQAGQIGSMFKLLQHSNDPAVREKGEKFLNNSLRHLDAVVIMLGENNLTEGHREYYQELCDKLQRIFTDGTEYKGKIREIIQRKLYYSAEDELSMYENSNDIR